MSAFPAVPVVANAVVLVGVLVGFVLYGFATLRARVLPPWCDVLFVAFLPVSMASGTSSPGWRNCC